MRTAQHHVAIAATPEEVWAVFAHLEGWAQWDQGISAVTDTQQGLIEGGTCTMTFSGGLSATTTFSNVRENQGLVWRAVGTWVIAQGHFEITPTETGCLLDYQFGMAGVLGKILTLLAFEAVIATGTRKDLEDIKQLAEGTA